MDEIDEQIEIADRFAKSLLDPKDIKKRMKEISTIRGTIIEMATAIERVLEEAIRLYDPAVNVYDLKFQNKADKFKKISKEQNIDEESFFKDLDEVVKIRNRYAHCYQEYAIKGLNIVDRKNNQTIFVKEDEVPKTLELFERLRSSLTEKFQKIVKASLQKKN